MVGSGPLDWRLAQPKPAATSRPGPSLAAPGAQERSRSGHGEGICLQFPIQLAPVAGDKHLIVAAFPTTPQENKSLVPLCGADAIAGGRAIIVTIVGAGFFSVGAIEATSKLLDLGHWCVCGCAESFTAPLVKRGKLDKSMPRLDAQEIKHRANPQSHDNPAPCRNLGRALFVVGGWSRGDSEKEPGSVSVSFF